jgi:Brp/Blh family beta-carotene 15,15'-monooxygenase
MTRDRPAARAFAHDLRSEVYSKGVNGAQIRVFDLMRNLSTYCAILSLLVGAIFTFAFEINSMGWQVVLALVALAVGIPHGALDHLVSIPRSSMGRMSLFILIYLLIAVVAVVAILRWNIAGFYLVVVMSALHFGIGDTAFLAERDRLNQNPSASRFAQVSYALASGSTPVIIPLVNDKSASALAMVNPSLIDWHRGSGELLLRVTVVLFVASVIIQVISKRNRDALDLILLGIIALVLPPLVAFAVYFGTWHALRHTARLTLNLASAKESFARNDAAGALRSALIPGLPALVATVLVAAAIAFLGGNLTDQFLWTLLVVIWALTVPHMMVTARLDRRALSKSNR